MASVFSGMRENRAELGARICPAPRSTATEFQGEPTQNPSISPFSSDPAISGGGMTTSWTSRSGSMPPAAR